jgi:TRAP-type mannitol/chloroaromatic compound transport system permease small subunit
MGKLTYLTQKIDSLNEKIGRFSGWLCLALALITAEQVAARYLFNAPSNALEELKWHLFGAIFLLAGAYTLQEDGHVRVDIFYHNFSTRKKAMVNTLGLLLFLIPSSLFILIYGIDFSAMAYNLPNPRPDDFYSLDLAGGIKGSFIYSVLAPLEGFLRSFLLRGEVSSAQGGLDARWLIKALIPFGFFLYILQAISMIAKNVLFLISTKNS